MGVRAAKRGVACLRARTGAGDELEGLGESEPTILSADPLFRIRSPGQ